MARIILDRFAILRNNQYLKARNAADSADVNVIKINASDVPEFAAFPEKSGTPTSANQLVNKSYVDSVAAAPYPGREQFTLVSGDITNQYIDLTNDVIKAYSAQFLVAGGRLGMETVDYTVSLTGGVGGKTRFTFAGDFATGGASPLIAGDVIEIKYLY